MPSRIYQKTVKDGCMKCGKNAYVLYKQDQTGQGTMLPPIMQRVWCDSGCLGGGLLDQETIQRHALP
jgi:hypothetical protein